MNQKTVVGVLKTSKIWLNKARNKNKLHHRSCFIFSRTNKSRIFLHKVTCSWQFEYFILFSIIASCVLLSIQGSRRELYSVRDPLTIADMTLNAVFVFEAIAKIITHGFIMHRGAYLRDGWNVFDFIVVLVGKNLLIESIYSYIFLNIFFQVLFT